MVGSSDYLRDKVKGVVEKKQKKDMENLNLILTTVLITLIAVSVVGGIAYLALVVRRLMGSVEELNREVSFIKLRENQNLEHLVDIHRVMEQDYTKQIDNVTNRVEEVNRKIDSRCDKLWDNLIREVQIRDEMFEMKSEKK